MGMPHGVRSQESPMRSSSGSQGIRDLCFVGIRHHGEVLVVLRGEMIECVRCSLNEKPAYVLWI